MTQKSKAVKRFSLAAKKRLLNSKFFSEVLAVVKAWDYYLTVEDGELSYETMARWFMAQSALEFITGNIYQFNRDGETYRVVNKIDSNDILIWGFSQKKVCIEGDSPVQAVAS